MERVPPPDKFSFPAMEEQVLALWQRTDAFAECVRQSEGRPEFTFYDGPPFATGLPHYGHLLAGTIKDTVTRFAHQTGHHVVRRFGWDCHGLPIEFEIDKAHGIKTKDDVLAMGIPAYNAACRAIVMRYSSEWRTIVSRLGRWIDFDTGYKTMDVNYMESVWWVFSELWRKNLVYQGFKVMPYSTACTTPLSNFESNLNYKPSNDPSVVVAFRVVADERRPELVSSAHADARAELVAWTTTPWTLPSNLALCVNAEFDYVRVWDTQRKRVFVIAKQRLSQLFPSETVGGGGGGDKKKKAAAAKDDAAPTPAYVIEAEFKGAALVGAHYEPLFDYFAARAETTSGQFYRVVADGYVKADGGTGIVHQAPAFGEDDQRVCTAAGVIVKGGFVPCPVDESGNMTAELPDVAGLYFLDANKPLRKALRERERLLVDGQAEHQYPFCWRSDTPLMYRAVPSWFIGVEQVRDRLVELNKTTRWVPPHIQHGRFANWLENARDWAVSRNRYWGTPLPIWVSADGKEKVCVRSRAHLAELAKLDVESITDLHRESVDAIEIADPRGAEYPPMRRVAEVFDCWFESGSMPYAQQHYPFENKEAFERNLFPASFVAEGLDQTRGWFYTLMVLGTALFDRAPFTNLIVNGMVLASDGKKMSKRLKNYPDPIEMVNKYGADAMRMYLINSPAVRADDLSFQADGVKDVLKDLMLLWYNAYRFFVENVERFNNAAGADTWTVDRSLLTHEKLDNVMDRWVLAELQSLVDWVRTEMSAYRLYTVTPRLVKFIEQLCNWYVRLNRARLKRADDGENAADCRVALNVLFDVLYSSVVLMAPCTPFFCEHLYQNLRLCLPDAERQTSVHMVMMPEVRAALRDDDIVRAVGTMTSVIELGRAARDRRRRPLKHPLTSVRIVAAPQVAADLRRLETYVRDELNVKHVVFEETSGEQGSSAYIALRLSPDMRALGQRLKGDRGKVVAALEALGQDDIKAFVAAGERDVLGHRVTLDDVQVVKQFAGDSARLEAAWSNDALVVLDLTVSEELVAEGVGRELMNRVQRLRKATRLAVNDVVWCHWSLIDSQPATSSTKKPAAAPTVAPTAAAATKKAAAKKGGGKKGGGAPPAAAAPAADDEPTMSRDDFLRYLRQMRDAVEARTGTAFVSAAQRSPHAVTLGTSDVSIDTVHLRLELVRPSLFADDASLAPLLHVNAAADAAARDAELAALRLWLAHVNPARIVAAAVGDVWPVSINARVYKLVVGTHVFARPRERQ